MPLFHYDIHNRQTCLMHPVPLRQPHQKGVTTSPRTATASQQAGAWIPESLSAFQKSFYVTAVIATGRTDAASPFSLNKRDSAGRPRALPENCPDAPNQTSNPFSSPSEIRYRKASAICCSSIDSLDARSAIVLATFKILLCARIVNPSLS